MEQEEQRESYSLSAEIPIDLSDFNGADSCAVLLKILGYLLMSIGGCFLVIAIVSRKLADESLSVKYYGINGLYCLGTGFVTYCLSCAISCLRHIAIDIRSLRLHTKIQSLAYPSKPE